MRDSRVGTGHRDILKAESATVRTFKQISRRQQNFNSVFTVEFAPPISTTNTERCQPLAHQQEVGVLHPPLRSPLRGVDASAVIPR